MKSEGITIEIGKNINIKMNIDVGTDKADIEINDKINYEQKSKAPVEVAKNDDRYNNTKRTKKVVLADYKKAFTTSKWKTLLRCICIVLAVSFGYLGYLKTGVNTPFDDKR